ncbi:MAG: hypothetical protein AB1410_07335 [Acidobacteriota bacterium]
MKLFLEGLKNFFLRSYFPAVNIQITSKYISGMERELKTGKIKNNFYRKIEEGIINEDWKDRNILDEKKLKDVLSIELNKFKKEPCISLLIPESSSKVFIFSSNSFPREKREAIEFVKWKIKRSVPIDKNLRISYDIFKNGNGIYNILALAINENVISEWEIFFNSMGKKISYVNIPTFTLYNCLKNERNLLLVNRDLSYTSFFAMANNKPIIYRIKNEPLIDEGFSSEITSTIKWIEERENKVMESIWIRDMAGKNNIKIQQENYKDKIKYFKNISESDFEKIPNDLSEILRPLMGIPLWRE